MQSTWQRGPASPAPNDESPGKRRASAARKGPADCSDLHRSSQCGLAHPRHLPGFPVPLPRRAAHVGRVATAHSMVVAAWHMLSGGTPSRAINQRVYGTYIAWNDFEAAAQPGRALLTCMSLERTTVSS